MSNTNVEIIPGKLYNNGIMRGEKPFNLWRMMEGRPVIKVKEEVLP